SQLARRPAILVHTTRLDDLLQEAELIIGVEDREAALQTHQLRVAAQDPGADRVEGSEPGHAFDSTADELPDAFFHLARRLVGEGDGEDLSRPRAAGGKDVGDARREHARLAGAGAGQDQHGALERFDGRALRLIETRAVAPPCGPRNDLAD